MIRFGTGGWRAIIADEFTKENIRLVTAGLCALMEAEGQVGATICLGYDRRFLSKEAMFWAAEVLAGYGFCPYVINRSVPTPLIMFTVKQMGLPYGLAITASHNPAIYNGIKIFTFGGRDADLTVTGKIEAEIEKLRPQDVKSIPYGDALAAGKIREGYPFNEYIDSILQMIDTGAIRRSRLRIAIDPMYGVSCNCLRTLLLTCRCDVDMIHDQHDTLFGGRMPAPSEETLRMLATYVVDNRCNLGIATDGDADRLGVIDEHGNYLHANTLLVEMLAVTGKTVAQLYREITEKYGMLCYEDAAFTMTPERKRELQSLVFEKLRTPDFGDGVVRINREDGCKIYFADGSWVICRFSGTEPLLRMAAEAATRQQARDYIRRWRELLEL